MLEAEEQTSAAEAASVAAEQEEADLSASIAVLEQKSSRMLQRELQALGVMDSLDTDQEVALADPDFVWAEMPTTKSIN